MGYKIYRRVRKISFLSPVVFRIVLVNVVLSSSLIFDSNHHHQFTFYFRRQVQIPINKRKRESKLINIFRFEVLNTRIVYHSGADNEWMKIFEYKSWSMWIIQITNMTWLSSCCHTKKLFVTSLDDCCGHWRLRLSPRSERSIIWLLTRESKVILYSAVVSKVLTPVSPRCGNPVVDIDRF